MGVIKTALEIALEKTNNVKSDKSSIDQFEAKRQGKKLANSFLAGDVNILDIIKKTPENIRESLKQGIYDVLITQIALPAGEEDDKKLEKISKGFSLIKESKKNEFSSMFKQLTQVFSQYKEEAAQYEQMIKQQYAPKLRKKEEEVSRRLGREVRIDPMQDPEFVTFYNQHMSALKSNYEEVVVQFKEEVAKVFDS